MNYAKQILQISSFMKKNKKYYRAPSNMDKRDEADKFIYDFENYKTNIHVDKGKGNDNLTKDFVKDHGLCIVDGKLGLLDNLFNTEKEVQLLYSELSGTKNKIEQLDRKKKELENKLNKPKVKPIEHETGRKEPDPTVATKAKNIDSEDDEYDESSENEFDRKVKKIKSK